MSLSILVLNQFWTYVTYPVLIISHITNIQAQSFFSGYFLPNAKVMSLTAQTQGAGQLSWANRTWRVVIPTKSPELLLRLSSIQLITAAPVTTTSLCSDSPHLLASLTTSDLSVWLPLTVFSTVALTAGSLAGVPSEKEVRT